MLVCYTLECGHGYNYRRHVKLTKDGKRWCKKCRELKKVTHIGEIPRLSEMGIFKR